MNRNLSKLASTEYDVVVVGAGIYGICAAWDAALRGLSVALLERGDFSGATSANPLKIVHGGFRYLQHADVVRIRQSSRERNVLMRIAPHLVHPLPFLIPTYGRGMRGKEVLGLALFVYDLLAFDRNRGIVDPEKHIPWGEVISAGDCLQRFPGLRRQGLTGALVFHDGQMYSPPRLALSYLKSAVDAGADVANYSAVSGFLRRGDRVTGVNVRDLLSGEELDVRAKIVVNATGPWTEGILAQLGLRLSSPLRMTKDVYLVVNRGVDAKYALAMPSRYADSDAILSRGRRHFFFIPWRNHTLIGSSHVLHEGEPGEFEVTEQDLVQLIEEINEAYPIGLSRNEVSFVNAGLVPFGDHYGHRSRIIDHGKADGVPGLVSIVGVRWTTSRGVAAESIDLVGRLLDRALPASATSTTPVHGGGIERFGEFRREAIEKRDPAISAESMRGLVHNHGASYLRVLEPIRENPSWAEALEGSAVIKAEVIHAVRNEMAHTLGDVVFRRTDLGTAGSPGEPALRECAALMASELHWDGTRVEAELAEVRQSFP